jgi:hypothetical protein
MEDVIELILLVPTRNKVTEYTMNKTKSSITAMSLIGRRAIVFTRNNFKVVSCQPVGIDAAILNLSVLTNELSSTRLGVSNHIPVLVLLLRDTSPRSIHSIMASKGLLRGRVRGICVYGVWHRKS